MIQVYFDILQDEPGFNTNKWAPLIKVSLSVPTGFLGLGPKKIITELRCLIDTGSDPCGIDTDIAEKNNIPKGQAGVMHGSAGAFATSEYTCDIVFDENITLPAKFYNTNLHRDHSLFDLTIGIEMLKNFEFRLRAREPSGELHYLGK
jgi:hypothetical protein